MKVQAQVWIGQEDSDGYWAEGEKATVEVELSDENEVRLGVQLGGEGGDAVTLYFNRATADKLARFLAAASVDDLRIRSDRAAFLDKTRP